MDRPTAVKTEKSAITYVYSRVAAAATAAADDDNDVSIRIRTVQYSTHITAP
jgi:hypothetical protein